MSFDEHFHLKHLFHLIKNRNRSILFSNRNVCVTDSIGKSFFGAYIIFYVHTIDQFYSSGTCRFRNVQSLIENKQLCNFLLLLLREHALRCEIRNKNVRKRSIFVRFVSMFQCLKSSGNRCSASHEQTFAVSTKLSTYSTFNNTIYGFANYIRPSQFSLVDAFNGIAIYFIQLFECDCVLFAYFNFFFRFFSLLIFVDSFRVVLEHKYTVAKRHTTNIGINISNDLTRVYIAYLLKSS